MEAQSTVLLKVAETETQIEAQEKKGGLWVDVGAVAKSLGLTTVLKEDILEIRFSTYTQAFDVKNERVRTRKGNKGKWRDEPFTYEAYFIGTHLMLPLEVLPEIFGRPFAYHLQKKILEVKGPASEGGSSGLRPVSLRRQSRNQKTWVSIEDLAKHLGVVLYSSQANVYNLVMPDFSILQVRVGENWIYKRNERYKFLDDPVVLMEGSPYLSVASVSDVFGIEAQWDRQRQVLMLPAQYGRLKGIQPPEAAPLRLMGYHPEPLSFSVEEMSAYYQTPVPSYPAPDEEVYDSVRDFFTNMPRRLPDTSDTDHLGGRTLVGLKGGFLGAPLEGKGEFEKVGPNARAVNGSLHWGFPKLELRGGREYIQMASLNGQYELMNFASLSHSNDSYGEKTADPEWTAKAQYGRNNFSVFMSTALFSQTVEYVQDMVSGETGVDWEMSDRQRLGVTLGQYYFINRVRGISSSNYTDDFLQEIFGEDFFIPTDPDSAMALAEEALGERHGTSLLDVNYKWDPLLQLSGTMGVSYFRENKDGRPWTVDKDWRLRSVVGGKKGKLDLSYENAGENYRSLGDPRRYQDRRITRMSPSLAFTPAWKVYGEFRREDSDVLVKTGGSSYRNDYWTVGQFLSFKKGSLNFYGSDYDSSLYGRRWSGNLDYTHYMGRDSVNVGAAWASQWALGDKLYRQSYTGRTGFEVLRPKFRFSLSEDLTRHHYKWYGLDKWESESRLFVQAGRYKALAQYSFEPRYFFDTPVLHTALFQIGRQVGEKKIINIFFSETSLHAGLKDPEVWRLGVSYVYDF